MNIKLNSNYAYIALGSNIKNPLEQLISAIKELNSHPKIKLLNASSLYLTKAWGFTNQPDFINSVCLIETDMCAHSLLNELHMIESKLGRTRDIRWGPRTCDLDILLFNNYNINDDILTIPHKEMYNRDFVIIPLYEIMRDSDNRDEIKNFVDKFNKSPIKKILDRIELIELILTKP